MARRYFLDLRRGANLTEQPLLELPLESFTYQSLVEYILNAIPPDLQPSHQTRFTWLFSRLKRCRLIQRHIDRIKDASDTSHVRTWDWLFGKLKQTIAEMREDANETSIREALGTSPKSQDDKAKAQKLDCLEVLSKLLVRKSARSCCASNSSSENRFRQRSGAVRGSISRHSRSIPVAHRPSHGAPLFKPLSWRAEVVEAALLVEHLGLGFGDSVRLVLRLDLDRDILIGLFVADDLLLTFFGELGRLRPSLDVLACPNLRPHEDDV